MENKLKVGYHHTVGNNVILVIDKILTKNENGTITIDQLKRIEAILEEK